MITVIIPTCDRPANFLSAAIASVLSQSLAPYELIIVDNGRNDAELPVLPEGVKVYRLTSQLGPSRARNFGAAMAKGTHLAFLDDDDWWSDDFLKEAWGIMQNDGSHCVYGRKDRYRNSRVERYKCPSSDTLTIPNLLRRNPGTGGQNLIIQKSLFWRVGGFDERMRTSEDKALAIEILRIGERISVATNAVAIMRNHDGERARQAVWHKFIFIWKYRYLLGRLNFAREIFRILKQGIISILKTRSKGKAS